MFEIYSSDTEEPQLNMSAFYGRKRYCSGKNYANMNVINENNAVNPTEQRINWSYLKFSIETAIEKLNPGNIRFTRNKLLQLNIVRAKGLLCQAIINAQSASLHCTNMYATLVSFINLEFPNVIELLLIRCICTFTNAHKFKEEDKYMQPILFITFMINHKVAKDGLAFDIIKLLIKSPTIHSMDMIKVILKVCGKKLKLNLQNELDLKYMFDTLENISQDKQIDKSVQCLAKTILTTYRDNFKDDEQQFDLVDPRKQYTHLLSLNSEYDPQYELDSFKYDLDYKSNEIIHRTNIRSVLKSKRKVYSFAKYDFDEMADDEDEFESETNMFSLSSNISIKKTISIMVNLKLSSLDIALELMQIKLKPGQEMQLCLTYLDCCFENSVVYNKFYGSILQNFCCMNELIVESLEIIFMQSYPIIHNYNPNKLVNLAKFFAQLLYSDSISWKVFSSVRLIESETSYSGRAYLKTIFKELIIHMGHDNLTKRILDPSLQTSVIGLFPFFNNHHSSRLCDYFFADIGLHDLTNQFIESFRGTPV
ncbi:pre-mRNA-splicing factor CWC22 homolog [Melanaphis sacchari]|uniref:pre-mRNA-splicing factor CWC22 homolog n=1 Tax=Melanaphis sacchari TaxID=742174 RepID=UPI000DC14770|nr:pre-mRNA-splicing factor CWC22 homolog [Melanaphis sacchari]